jgi:hypothetical protein
LADKEEMYPHLFHLIVEIFEIELDQNELLANFNLNILFFFFVPTKQKLVSNWGKKNIFRLSRENFGSNKFIMADGHILQIHQKTVNLKSGLWH